ncbi:MAG: zf-HC2 domain-containing protein [Anaerolineae bacterium]
MFGFLGRSGRAGHRFCQHNLSAYLDGELTARDQERVRLHLQQCEACQWNLQTLQRTVALLRSLPQVRAPRSFQIPRSTPAPSVPFWMHPWAYGALRVATGVTAVILMIALAGNALVLPVGRAPMAGEARNALQVRADGAAEAAPHPASGYVGEEPPAEAEAAVVGRTPHEGTPSTRGDKDLPAMSFPTPPCEDCGEEIGAGAQALAPEEAARATAAPPGLGERASPTVQAEVPGAVGGEGVPQPTAPPPSVEAPLVAPAPTQATIAKALPQAPTAEIRSELERGVPQAPDDEVERFGIVQQALEPNALTRLRQSVAGYPWGWWVVASGVLLAALLATTLWLRARRARWPW